MQMAASSKQTRVRPAPVWVAFVTGGNKGCDLLCLHYNSVQYTLHSRLWGLCLLPRSRIGLECCRQLAALPGVQCILGSRDTDRGAAAAAALNGQTKPTLPVIAVQCDICDPSR